MFKQNMPLFKKIFITLSKSLYVNIGMLQKQHPDIALSIKTRQAIRSVLNSLRDGIHELMMDGILEEADGHKLEKVKFSYIHVYIMKHI